MTPRTYSLGCEEERTAEGLSGPSPPPRGPCSASRPPMRMGKSVLDIWPPKPWGSQENCGRCGPKGPVGLGFLRQEDFRGPGSGATIRDSTHTPSGCWSPPLPPDRPPRPPDPRTAEGDISGHCLTWSIPSPASDNLELLSSHPYGNAERDTPLWSGVGNTQGKG